MKPIYLCAFITVFLLSNEGAAVNAARVISYEIEMLPWKEVNRILPKYSIFKVMDVETGKQFRVQRRAGSRHADVQPVTKKDTKVMRKIYNGKWNWKRRAIIVVHGDQWIAASMHGMPHGAGALTNDFPGHFCIHFFGSTTHRTNKMDLSHKLMIYKAAGKLEEHLAKSDPNEAISAYIAGFKQQDEEIVSLVSLQQVKWDKILSAIENVKIDRMPEVPVEDAEGMLILSVPVEVEWYMKSTGKKVFKGKIHLVRFSVVDPWKIDSNLFLSENNLIKQ